MAFFIGNPNFQMLTPDQTNPFQAGLTKALAQHLSMQNVRKNRKMMPFIAPQAQANLEGTQLNNKKTQLANLLSQAQLPYAGPQASANLKSTQLGNALSQLKLNNPGLLSGGSPAQIAALELMGIIKPQDLNNQGGQAQGGQGMPQGGQPQMPQGQQQAQGPSTPNQMSNSNMQLPFHTGNQMIDSMMNLPYMNANLSAQRARGYAWNSLPADAKDYAIASAAGAGMDPTKASNLLANGSTMDDIYKMQGFDPKNPPPPDFLPTKGNVTQLNSRKAALKEIDSLSDFITKGLGPYARTINGMSPSQAWDAIRNKDPDKQARFLSARQLAPELANIRLKLAQGQVGLGAMNEVMQKSLTDAKAMQSLVTPEVFAKSQKMTDAQLKKAFSKAQTIYDINQQDDTSSASSESDTSYSAGDESKIKDAMKKHGLTREDAIAGLKGAGIIQ
jgi:hypothetical protein